MSKKTARFYVGKTSQDLQKAGVVISIGEINRSKEMTEDDDLESAETGYSRRTPGMKSVDDITFTIRHDSQDEGKKLADESYEDDVEIHFEARYPDKNKTCIKGKGFVSGISVNSQETSTTRVERNITIAVNGGISETVWEGEPAA